MHCWIDWYCVVYRMDCSSTNGHLKVLDLYIKEMQPQRWIIVHAATPSTSRRERCEFPKSIWVVFTMCLFQNLQFGYMATRITECSIALAYRQSRVLFERMIQHSPMGEKAISNWHYSRLAFDETTYPVYYSDHKCLKLMCQGDLSCEELGLGPTNLNVFLA